MFGVDLEWCPMDRPGNRHGRNPSPSSVEHGRTDTAHSRMLFLKFDRVTVLAHLVEDLVQFARIGNGFVGEFGQWAGRQLTLLFFKPSSSAISVTPRGERTARISSIRSAFSIERYGFDWGPEAARVFVLDCVFVIQNHMKSTNVTCCIS